MRPVIYIIIVCLLVGCADNKKNHNMYKQVQSCMVYTSDFALLDPNDLGMLIQKFEFNGHGFVCEMVRYGFNGEIVGRFKIDGNECPLPIPDMVSYKDTTVEFKELNPNGLLISKLVKSFNTDGMLTAIEETDGKGVLLRKNTYTYNERGLISQDIYWDVDLDLPTHKINYVYEYYSDNNKNNNDAVKKN